MPPPRLLTEGFQGQSCQGLVGMEEGRGTLCLTLGFYHMRWTAYNSDLPAKNEKMYFFKQMWNIEFIHSGSIKALLFIFHIILYMWQTLFNKTIKNTHSHCYQNKLNCIEI
jgi:hypothetical protein